MLNFEQESSTTTLLESSNLVLFHIQTVILYFNILIGFKFTIICFSFIEFYYGIYFKHF